MSNIMQKPKPSLYNPSKYSYSSHNKFITLIFGLLKEMVIKPSMNRDIRRKELIKITIENQAILRRLQAKGATYSVEKWQKDFE